MAALLSSDIDGRNFQRKDALVEHRDDCLRMGIKILPPDINQSMLDFAVIDGQIRFGLSAIKACGGEAVQQILDARKSGGKFRDFLDFCERVDVARVNRAMLETLIKSGAFDGWGAARAQLMALIDRALTAGAAVASDRRQGQKNLFDDLEETAQDRPAMELPNIPEWNEREKVFFEKEVLGFFLTSHPLDRVKDELARYCTHTTDQLPELRDRTEVHVGGLIGSIKCSHVKKARSESEPTKFANFDLEDTRGAVRCILWPNDYEKYGSLIEADTIRVLRGFVDRRGGGDEINLIVNEVLQLEDMESKCARSVTIHLDETYSTARLKELRDVARAFPGSCELLFELALRDGERVSLKSHSVRVDSCHEFRQRVQELISPGHVEISFEVPKAKSNPPGYDAHRPIRRRLPR
jgi:DNA polymerase-3 subunit alpha